MNIRKLENTSQKLSDLAKAKKDLDHSTRENILNLEMQKLQTMQQHKQTTRDLQSSTETAQTSLMNHLEEYGKIIEKINEEAENLNEEQAITYFLDIQQKFYIDPEAEYHLIAKIKELFSQAANAWRKKRFTLSDSDSGNDSDRGYNSDNEDSLHTIQEFLLKLQNIEALAIVRQSAENIKEEANSNISRKRKLDSLGSSDSSSTLFKKQKIEEKPTGNSSDRTLRSQTMGSQKI